MDLFYPVSTLCSIIVKYIICTLQRLWGFSSRLCLTEDWISISHQLQKSQAVKVNVSLFQVQYLQKASVRLPSYRKLSNGDTSWPNAHLSANWWVYFSKKHSPHGGSATLLLSIIYSVLTNESHGSQSTPHRRTQDRILLFHGIPLNLNTFIGALVFSAIGCFVIVHNSCMVCRRGDEELLSWLPLRISELMQPFRHWALISCLILFYPK